MSALPPKADVIGRGAGCPLLTQSGHWEEGQARPDAEGVKRAARNAKAREGTRALALLPRGGNLGSSITQKERSKVSIIARL